MKTDTCSYISLSSNIRVSRLFWMVVVLGSLGSARIGLSQTPIVCGQTISNNLPGATQTVTYTYAGTAGQVVSLAFYWGCSAGSGSADVYFPGATSPSTNLTASCGAKAIKLTLPNSGTYK